MVRFQNIQGKHGIFSLFFLLLCDNKQQDIMSLAQHFIIIQSDQDLCQFTKLMNTIEHISRLEQLRQDPDETEHRLRTFAIRM